MKTFKIIIVTLVIGVLSQYVLDKFIEIEYRNNHNDYHWFTHYGIFILTIVLIFMPLIRQYECWAKNIVDYFEK